jgi:hypothetical protein
MVGIIAALAGCAAPVDYDATLAICGPRLAPGESAALLGDGTLGTLSEECAARLGEDVGLDWESFGVDGPEEVTALTRPHEVVLGGLQFLLLSNTGTVSEALSSAWVPPRLKSKLAGVRDDYGLSDDAPMSQLFYLEVATNTRAVVMEEELDSDERDASMSFGSLSRALLVAPGVDYNNLEAGSTLLHEVAHRWTSHSRLCLSDPSSNVDEDPDSAYGAEAFFLYRYFRSDWLMAPGYDDPESQLYEVAEVMQRTCGHILDRGGFEPCGWAESLGYAPIEVECE